jgi:CHAD domain-containing protein
VKNQREIEIKFKAVSSETLEPFRRQPELFPGFVLAPPKLKLFTDYYCDTADFAFMRTGYALRFREIVEASQEDRPVVQTMVSLKSLNRPQVAGLHDRFELEGPVESVTAWSNWKEWPEPVRTMAEKICGHAVHVTVIAALKQERQTRCVQLVRNGNAPHVVAELSADVVAVFEPAHGDSADELEHILEHIGDFYELEIEAAANLDALKLDMKAVLNGWVKELKKMTGLKPATSSKLERALRMIAWHPPGSPPNTQGIQSPMPMAEAGRLIWRGQLLEILTHESGARSNIDIEYIHAMRVATRRARSAANVFGPFFEKRAIKPFLKGLRKTARKLGAVRDLDVALEELEKYSKKQPKAEQSALNALANLWKQAREQAFQELVAWLDSPRYHEFIAEFYQFCRTPGTGTQAIAHRDGGAPVPYQVRHVMPSTILEEFEEMRAYEVLFEQGTTVPPETLHALRIDGKRLRYSLEFLGNITGAKGKTVLKKLKRLQDLLGALNDSVVARNRIEQAIHDGLDQEAIHRYIAFQEQVFQSHMQTFPTEWQSFLSVRNREMLAKIIARI